MATIHALSKTVPSSILDVFALSPTVAQVLKSDWQAYTPQAALGGVNGGENGVIDFVVGESGESYVNLAETYLYLTASIRRRADDGFIEAADTAGPVDNLIHSAFSQLDVSLNENVITQSTHTYGYKSFIENLCNYGSDSVRSTLSCEMFVPDTPGQHDTVFTVGANNVVTCANEGLMKRRRYFVDAAGPVELIGKPHFNLACQPKLLLANSSLKFTFNRQKDAFCLMSNAADTYKLVVESAVLYVKKCLIDPATVLAQHRLLEGGETAKYPSLTGVVRKYAISQGVNEYTVSNLGLSRLPKRIILGFVKSSAATGAHNRNPFNFVHTNVSFVGASLDGILFPQRGMKPNFAGGKYLECYYHLLAACNCDFNSDNGLQITRDSYPRGHTLFAVQFSPVGTEEAFDVVKSGSLRLDVNFSVPLPEATTLVAYCEYQSLLEVNFNKAVTFDQVV